MTTYTLGAVKPGFSARLPEPKAQVARARRGADGLTGVPELRFFAGHPPHLPLRTGRGASQ